MNQIWIISYDPAGQRLYDGKLAWADGNEAATAIWVELTQSLYDFNCNFDDYTDQCSGFSPVQSTLILLTFKPVQAPDVIALALGFFWDTYC